MRKAVCTVVLCVVVLLVLPGAARAEERRPIWSPQELASLLGGFLKIMYAEERPIDETSTGVVVCSTTCGGGVTISCSGTSCSKESGRCVKCGSSAQFCAGTTGTNCGTSSTVSVTNVTIVNAIFEAVP